MIIGLFDRFDSYIDEKNQNYGGSETWLLEVANAFSDLGHTVHVFCNCKFHTFNKITFIPKQKFKEVVSVIEYDKFIYSRGVYSIDSVKAKNISVMLHDERLFNLDNSDLNKLSNFYLLSKHSMEMFSKIYGNKFEQKYKLTFNGINQNIFKPNTKKENMMVWSSCSERGYDYFINKIYPSIKKAVPDFKVYVCQYKEKFLNTPNGVKYLGRLDKQKLAELQSKAKLWCYPNLGYLSNGVPFNETFCITAIENAFAGANIVCGYNGALTTTLGEDKLVGKDYFKNKKCIDEDGYANYLAKICIKILKNEYENKCDVSKYTWKNAALSLL